MDYHEASQLVQLDASKKLPAVDGSSLTAVPASVANTSLNNLTTAGKSVISNLSSPATSTISLTLGATNSTYTAPSDGYICVGKLSTAAGQGFQFNTNTLATSSIAAVTSQTIWCYIEVQKGQVVTYSYTLGGTTLGFIFTPKQGEV